MKTWQKNGVLVVALVAFGAVRMPFEAVLSKDLREAGLTPTPLDIETKDKIGQTSSAVALGGLRTLVATFLNLRAFGFFQERRWDDVADTYDTIVALAPRTTYYWETGSWHMAYNASSYYLNDSKLPALRRREAWRASIMTGKAFLERGIRNNPDEWRLHANLGFLLSDSNKYTAFRDPNETFAAAADAYKKAAATGHALEYVTRSEFYSLARVEGREAEALAMARALYKLQKNRTPTLEILMLVLESYENKQLNVEKRAVEIFGTPEKAYDALSGHWLRTKERFPVYGVATGLEALEKTLNIPPDKSVLNKPPTPPQQ